MFNMPRNVPGSPASRRRHILFYVSLLGLLFLVIGPNLTFAHGTASTAGYGQIWSDSIKGTQTNGVGWWPFVLGVAAAGLLFLATLTSTLSTRVLEAVAGVLGLWVVIYDWIRLSDVSNLVSDKAKAAGAPYGATFDTKVDGQIGFWLILLGGLIVAGVAFTMVFFDMRAARQPTVAALSQYGPSYPGQQYGQQPYGGQPYGGPPPPPAGYPPQAPPPPPPQPQYGPPAAPPRPGPAPPYGPPPGRRGDDHPLPPAAPTYGRPR